MKHYGIWLTTENKWLITSGGIFSTPSRNVTQAYIDTIKGIGEVKEFPLDEHEPVAINVHAKNLHLDRFLTEVLQEHAHSFRRTAFE